MVFNDANLNKVLSQIDLCNSNAYLEVTKEGFSKINYIQYVINRILSFLRISDASNPEIIADIRNRLIDRLIITSREKVSQSGDARKDAVELNEKIKGAMVSAFQYANRVEASKNDAELEAELKLAFSPSVNNPSDRIIYFLETLVRNPKPVSRETLNKCINAFFESVEQAYASNSKKLKKFPDNDAYRVNETELLRAMNKGIQIATILLGKRPVQADGLATKYNLGTTAAMDTIVSADRAIKAGADADVVLGALGDSNTSHGIDPLLRHIELAEKLKRLSSGNREVGSDDHDDDDDGLSVSAMPKTFPREFVID